MNQSKSFLVPEGWRWVPFGSCANLVNGRAYKQSELLSSGTPVLRIQNLNGGDRWYYSDLSLPENKYCQKGDLLYAWSATFGPYLWTGPRCIYHYHIWKIEPEPHLDKLFGYYLLQWISKAVKQAAHGITMVHMTKEGMESWLIPLPPLEEQRRIAAILDKADAVRRKRQQAIALTEQLLRSAFLEMFGDPVTNPKGWAVDVLENFGQIITGNTPPRANLQNYGNLIEWIKSDNITTPSHFLTEAAEKLSYHGKKIGRVVPAGSVLVVCIAGSRSSIGRAALTDREVAFNQQINAVVPNSNVDPYFLYTQFFIAQELVQSQSTDSMKGLVSKSKFSSIQFIKPPEQKQREFGNWFLNFHKWSLNLHKDIQLSNNLFNSLLQKAFNGEI